MRRRRRASPAPRRDPRATSASDTRKLACLIEVALELEETAWRWPEVFQNRRAEPGEVAVLPLAPMALEEGAELRVAQPALCLLLDVVLRHSGTRVVVALGLFELGSCSDWWR